MPQSFKARGGVVRSCNGESDLGSALCEGPLGSFAGVRMTCAQGSK